MTEIDPTSGVGAVDDDALSRVATLVRVATRLANAAAGVDLRSPWLDVVTETVTAAGYLTDIPDQPAIGRVAGYEDDTQGRRAGTSALQALERAADALDHAVGRRDHRAVLVRAALTDAIATARRIPS